MGDDYSLGSKVDSPSIKPLVLHHWRSLPWSEARTLNDFYKLANDKQSHIMIIDAEINEDNLPTLATYISSSTTLNGICFSNNGLGDIGLKNLLTQVYTDGGRQIETLAVNNNNLTTVSAKTIGKIIGNDFCNIQRLSLANNPLKDTFAKSFVKFLKLNYSIFELDLADSGIDFAGVSSLVKVFKFNTTILQFHMQNISLDISEKEEHTPAPLTNLEMYSNRLLTETKAGRKMKPKKKQAMGRIIQLADKCINRNLRIRYAKARCADILRKGSYPVRLQAARITLLGAEQSGKTGVAHALLGKCPIYYPSHNPTISLATAVLQTFQPESREFDDLLKHLSTEMALEKKDKYYSRKALVPFALLSEKDVIEMAKKKSKLRDDLSSIQLWRATRRNFDGIVALCSHREARSAAQKASAVDDESPELAGKTLFTNPESINERIQSVAGRYAMGAGHLDRDSVLLPKVHLDELSVGSWDLENEQRNNNDLGATLAVAGKSHEEVMRLNFLFDDVDSEVTFKTRRGTRTQGDNNMRSRNEGSKVGIGSQAATTKYKNFKQANSKGPDTTLPKISTTDGMLDVKDNLFWNPLVLEPGIGDIATDDILFRSHFADTCIFNLFDLGGGQLAQMLAKFAIIKDGINTLVFDMERAAKADLGMSDVIREELTMWYRCIELFSGKNPCIIVVGTGKDIIDRLASHNIVTDKKTDYGRLNAGATANTMKRKKGGFHKDTKDVVRNIFLSLNQDIVLSVVDEENENLVSNEKEGLSFFPISNLFVEGMEPIKDIMEQHARQLGNSLDYHVPLRWLKLLELTFARYAEDPQAHYRLKMKSVLQLANSIGFSCKKEVELCLQKFDQLGFWQYNGYTQELAKWLILDSVPIFKSLLRFAQNHRIDLAMSPAQEKIEKAFPKEVVLLRNHGILSKNLFKALWQGGQEKEDLNFGVKWLTEHYFMTELLMDGERFFFFPSFLRTPEYFQKKAALVDSPRERYFFAVSFGLTGYIPPALLPRLIALLFGANIQENHINLVTPLKSTGELHPAFNLFSKANTTSRLFLTRDQIRIQIGGQVLTMTKEGSELIFGLSQEVFANRIVVLIHAMLTRINNDVYNGGLLWDILFFHSSQTKSYTQAMGSFSGVPNAGPVPPPRTGYRTAAPSVYSNNKTAVHSTYGNTRASHGSEGLVAYETDDEEDTTVGITGRRVRLSFNDARSKKIRPFFQNEMDNYEACLELWQGARNSAEALHKFKTQEVPENLEDYCNHLKHRYLSNAF